MTAFDKNNPFKTPKSYFDNFRDKLMSKLNEEKLELPKEDGFKLPKGYFDGLHGKIVQKLSDEPKVVQLHSYRKYYLIAASVAAGLLLFFGLNLGSEKEVNFNDIALVEIETYLDAKELELTSYEIAEELPIDELEINEILENQINEEEVIDYLNDSIDDFEELNMEDYE